MPLTKQGEEVMAAMKKKYGDKKGMEVFYASRNKGNAGSSKWEHKKKKVSGKSYSKEEVDMAREIKK
jgi:hypothetical protein